jgi:predicted ester cyclase
MPTRDEMEELAREFNERGLSGHDLEYMSGMLSEDFVEHNPLPGLGHDKQGALESFKALFAATPDAKGEIIRLVIDGNKMAIHSRFSGTDNGTGQMPGVPPTGKSFTADSIDVVTVNDQGRFTEHYGIFDVPAVMVQLGLMEPPPAPR